MLYPKQYISDKEHLYLQRYKKDRNLLQMFLIHSNHILLVYQPFQTLQLPTVENNI